MTFYGDCKWSYNHVLYNIRTGLIPLHDITRLKYNPMKPTPGAIEQLCRKRRQALFVYDSLFIISLQ